MCASRLLRYHLSTFIVAHRVIDLRDSVPTTDSYKRCNQIATVCSKYENRSGVRARSSSAHRCVIWVALA